MLSYIEYLKDNYLDHRLSKDKDIIDEFRRLSRLNTKRIEQSDLLTDYPDIRVTFSRGQYTNLPIIPWVTFFDKNITTSPKSGYYLVYLFNPDLTKVYLSLNQGWTQYEDSELYSTINQGREAARNVAEQYRKILGLNNTDKYLKSINLEAPENNYALGYEACNIIALEYDLYDLPTEEGFKTDLELFLETYYSLAALVKEDNIEEIIKSDFSEINQEDLKKPSYEIELKEPPKLTLFEPKDKKASKKSKIDYEEIGRVRKKIGDLGEKFVFEFERKRLNDLGYDPNVVLHISLKDDSAGYDIQSLNDNGEKIYIEVKSTSSNDNQPFIISSNEYEMFEELSDNYFIYRVYNLYSSPKLFVIDYPYFKKLMKKPLDYIIYLRHEKLD